ncbi:MAG TPA: type II secretion system protein [Candidatus Gracilibacteria bacterium]|nr:type II secretion system protein [Candidatus Gracilibacteria bacterium]
MKNTATKKGFTLIELLIVITIIGILAAALLPSILGAPARARDAARAADLNQIVTALETYASDNNGAYPANDGAGCIDEAILGPFFQGGVVPSDPQGGDTGDCTGSYMYCPLDTPNNYLLAAKLEIVAGQGATHLEANVTGMTCDGSASAPANTGDGTNEDTLVILK